MKIQVRTGDSHPFGEEESQTDIFEVSALPSVDYASRALRTAQDAYFKQWPDARKHAGDLLWTIAKR